MRSLFTAENRAAVIARLELGQAVPQAAEGSGLKKATVQGWIARGKRDEAGDYADFAAAVVRAQNRRPVELMTPEEHWLKVSEVARGGNVQALKLYWEIICADRKPAEEKQDPLEELDELAERRSVRVRE